MKEKRRKKICEEIHKARTLHQKACAAGSVLQHSLAIHPMCTVWKRHGMTLITVAEDINAIISQFMSSVLNWIIS